MQKERPLLATRLKMVSQRRSCSNGSKSEINNPEQSRPACMNQMP